MRLAAIDIGTNSTKMTVADVGESGLLSVVSEQSDVTRLGEGVDASRHLGNAAMARTLEAIIRFADAAQAQGAETVLGAGTSALRDAANGPDFIQQVRKQSGVEVQIITGDREAQLAYAAVRSDVSLSIPAEANLLVFDIGGGSTELILGDASGVGRYKSLDIGAVRLTERCLSSDPPALFELDQARQFASDAFAAFPQPDPPLLVAGIGGTALNIAAVTQGLVHPDPDSVHGASLSSAEVAAALSRFSSAPLAERRSIPGLEPKRADVIVAGALILDTLLTYFHADHFLLSSRGLRYGLLADYAKSNK
jgi:exopolyphosphatase/guanosine-5'-triphosphate,3'-diphosphate pyrophosphatase